MISSQLFIKWIFISIIYFVGANNSFSALQESSGRQPRISQQFYKLLAKINRDSIAAQLPKIEAFVTDFPQFSPSARWLFDKYVIARDLQRAELFFANLPDSGLSLRTKKWMLGKVYSRREQSNEALEAFTIALTAASPSAALVLDFLRFDRLNLRRFENPDYLEELALDKETLDIMHALWNSENRRFHLAVNQFKRLSGHSRDDLTVLYSWGYCLNRSGQNNAAKKTWQRGLELARALGDLWFESWFLLGLGIIAQDLDTELSYYDSSYELARKIGDLRQMAYLAGNQAILYSRQGRFGLADSLFLEAIDAGRKMQSPRSMSVWYRRYGNLLIQQDRFDEALKAYDDASVVAKKASIIDLLIQCQIREGELYRILEKYELAHRALNGAFQEARDRNWPLLERQAHIQLAHLDFATRRYEEARQVYALYLKSPPMTRHDLEDHAWWRFRAGLTYLAENNHSAARSELSKAYVLADSIEANFRAAASLLYLAEIDLVENDFERAHERLDECLTLGEETELSQVLPAIYSLRGDAFQKEGKLEKALRQYKKAANLIEQTRENLVSEASKLDYFGGKSDIYDKLVECYRESYATTGNAAYKDSLYVYMEMKRGRTLRELRAGNGAETGDSDSDFRRDKLLQAGKRLRSQQRYLRDYGALFTKQEMDSVLAQVQTARLSLIAQRLRITQDISVGSDELETQLPSLEKLRSTMEANQSAAIFYHLSEHPFALAITGEATTVVSLPTTITRLDSSIQSLLNPFHRVTQDASEALFKADLAYELYRALVAPIEDAVQLPANLVIAPDAQLANLPFELLLTAKPQRSDYTTSDPATYSDHFLIQRYSIGYVPNASFLINSDFGTVSKNVLVFADPFDEAQLTDGQLVASLRTGLRFDPLIYSSKEAAGIKKVHPKTAIFRREKATKEALFREAPRYDIVHIISHAFVDTTHDAFSGLVLSTSDDKEDDGILMGYEIADMDLQADLVTLSACETGRGKIVAGEGVLGLPRLFLGAGASTVLMTHWKVSDKFSSVFMPEFYRYYIKEGLSKAEALSLAKRDVLKDITKGPNGYYQHPFFWAAFTLYGDPGIARKKSNKTIQFLLIAMIAFVVGGFFYNQYFRKQSAS